MIYRTVNVWDTLCPAVQEWQINASRMNALLAPLNKRATRALERRDAMCYCMDKPMKDLLCRLSGFAYTLPGTKTRARSFASSRMPSSNTTESSS